MTTLSNDELRRYSRHRILPEIGGDGQPKLKEMGSMAMRQ